MVPRLMFRIRRYQKSSSEKPIASLPKTLIFEILRNFEQIAYNYSKLDLQYSVKLQSMLSGTRIESEDDEVFDKDVADNFALLDELLLSDNPKHRKSGEAWLFGLAKAAIDGKVNTQQLRSRIASTFDKVVSYPDPLVRRIHIRVTEKMVI